MLVISPTMLRVSRATHKCKMMDITVYSVSEGKFDQAVTVRSEVIKDAPRNLLSWLLEEDEASTPLLSASNRKDLQYSSISNDLLRSVSHLAQLSANMFQTNPLQIQCLVERDDRMTQIDCLNLNIQ